MPPAIKSITGLVLSVVIVGAIASLVDMGALADTMFSADYRFLAPSLAVYALGLVTRAERWRVLLSKHIPLKRVFHIMNIGYFANSVLPLRLGEVARVFLTSRASERVTVMGSASTILIERLLDVLAVTLCGALAMAVAPLSDEIRRAGVLGALAAIGAFTVLIALAYWRERTTGLIDRFCAVLPGRVGPPLRRHALDFLAGLTPLLSRSVFSRALLWTGASWLLSALTNYILMFAFFDKGDAGAVLLGIALAAFAIAIPFVPANIGTYEAAIIGAFLALGYEQLDTITAFAVAVHAMSILASVGTGALGLVAEGVSLRQLREQVSS